MVVYVLYVNTQRVSPEVREQAARETARQVVGGGRRVG